MFLKFLIKIKCLMNIYNKYVDYSVLFVRLIFKYCIYFYRVLKFIMFNVINLKKEKINIFYNGV